jgi:1D-myo-inositol-tetrakisphosphate 5-kinase/inositol-polyphosphate multikinase
VIECFIDTIIEIRDAIIEFANLRLIGSSLLFIYEGDAAAADKTWKHMLEEDSSNSPKGNNKEGQIDEEEEGEGELVPKMCDLRLIDFAHSDWHAERKEQDPELIQGFDNIIKILEDCLERQRQEKL